MHTLLLNAGSGLDLALDIFSWIISLAAVIFAATLAVNTVKLKKPKIPAQKPVYNLDRGEMASRLSEAIKIPTVSPAFLGDNADNFIALEKYLEKAYPLLHRAAHKTVVNSHAIILKIEGSDSNMLAMAFLAHQDVVPAQPDGWTHPPFSGDIVLEDGQEFVYGRGALDMKGQLIAIMESAEYLLKHNFTFKRTLYICLGFDEELTGELGALKIVEHLKEQGVELEYVIDEGGLVTDGKMLGISGNVALIGTGEKGYADFRLTATRDGGHSSAPVHPTSVEVLAKGIARLSKAKMPVRWTANSKAMLTALAPHMKLSFRIVCANRAIFSPILKKVLASAHPAAAAVMRTTFAPTTITGSDALNTIAKTASVNINCRLLQGDSYDSVKAFIQKKVGKHISVEHQPESRFDPPSAESPADTLSYKIIEKTVAETFEKLIPAPFTFIAASDAKFYYPIARHVYRFSPFILSIDDAERIHGANEKVSSAALSNATAFFIRIIENSQQDWE